MTSAPGSGRRRSDRRLALAVSRVIGIASTSRIDPVRLGRVLLVVAAALIAMTAPLLDLGDAWARPAFVSLGLLAAFGASFVVPWEKRGPRTTLVFPLLVCVALVLLSGAPSGAFAPLTGLLSLGFAYIGLTQPPRTAVATLPAAAVAFVLTNGAWSAATAIRLFIACFVWAILGEVLSLFVVRQAAMAEVMRTAAHTDALTGVANRRDLELHLAVTVPGDMIVICDLDHFKALNDTRGHEIGDRVLSDFGAMLRATLREKDYCARYGGEEFVLVLPTTAWDEAEATLARMRANWAVLHPDTTFSAGLAMCSDDRTNLDTLAAADRGLYAAKAAGRNRNADDDVRSRRLIGGG